MSSYYYGKPKLVETRPHGAKAKNETCLREYLEKGKLRMCGKPSEGRNHCADCRRHLLTLTDRTPYSEAVQAKPYSWSAEIWKRKSA